MIALLLGLAQAATVTPDSQPSRVVVYANQARVTREVQVRLDRGTHEVVLTGLPATLIGGSVAADVTGNARSAGVDLARVTATEAADARVAALLEQREALSAERRTLLDQEESARAALAWLANARTQSSTALSAQLLGADQGPRTAEALQAELSRREEAALAERRRAERARREVEERIAAIDREHRALGSAATDAYTATVRVRVERSGTVGVQLSYGVANASWTPRYDIRGTASSGEVEVALSAEVSQQSGEDWSEVTLAVSSARPDRGTDAPELDPFWLRRPVPQRSLTRSVAKKSMAMAEMDDMAYEEEAFAGAPAPPPPAPMEVVEAQVETQLMATTFTVEDAVALPSDGTSRRVRLTTAPMEAELTHVAVPRLAQRVYLVGEVTNTAGFPLLAGEAGVFLDQDYLGLLQVDTVAPGESLDVAFGVDDRVRIERVPAQLKEGDAGLFGKRARSSWRWKLAVTNAHDRPVTVEVREQVPVTTLKEVEVALLPQQGGPAVAPDDEGLMHWTVDVGAKGETGFTWGYRVDHPAELALGWME